MNAQHKHGFLYDSTAHVAPAILVYKKVPSRLAGVGRVGDGPTWRTPNAERNKPAEIDLEKRGCGVDFHGGLTLTVYLGWPRDEIDYRRASRLICIHRNPREMINIPRSEFRPTR